MPNLHPKHGNISCFNINIKLNFKEVVNLVKKIEPRFKKKKKLHLRQVKPVFVFMLVSGY